MTNVEILDWLVKLVMLFEGFEPKAYRCPAGIWTIGYGETLGVTEGMVWTEEHARQRLRTRLAQFMLGTYKRCPQLHVEPAGRIVACTSLAYNIGVGAFGASSVCRKTTRFDFVGAAISFMLWNKAGGRVLKGLTKRRRTESKVYSEAVA